MKTIENKRKYSLDIVRIIATMAVVMIHCSCDFLIRFLYFEKEFSVGNIFDAASQIGVPLFMMISGALFLDESKEITLKIILQKYVKLLLIIIVIWSVVYTLVNNVAFTLLDGDAISVKKIFIGILDGNYHIWYLYMLIAIYISTPILRKFVCVDNQKIVLLYIGISLCVVFLPSVFKAMQGMGINVAFINTIITKFKLSFYNAYITYYLVGWYIVHIGIKQKKYINFLYLLGIVSLIIMIRYVDYTGDYDTAYNNVSMFVFLYSVSVFLLVNNIRFNFGQKTAKRVVSISKYTFGIYIIHPLILEVLKRVFPYTKYCALYILGSYVFVLMVSFMLVLIISKIPGLKKIIKI